MNRTPVPDDDDSCWVCRRLHIQCNQECPHRLPPDHPTLLGPDGRPRNKYDLYVQLIHFQHGQRRLHEMGHHSLAAIPFFSIPPLPPPPPVPKFQSSPSKRKREGGADAGQSDLGIRPAKAVAVLDSVTEVALPQEVETADDADLMMGSPDWELCRNVMEEFNNFDVNVGYDEAAAQGGGADADDLVHAGNQENAGGAPGE